jgi:hypothetical protein
MRARRPSALVVEYIEVEANGELWKSWWGESVVAHCQASRLLLCHCLLSPLSALP